MNNQKPRALVKTGTFPSCWLVYSKFQSDGFDCYGAGETAAEAYFNWHNERGACLKRIRAKQKTTTL